MTNLKDILNDELVEAQNNLFDLSDPVDKNQLLDNLAKAVEAYFIKIINA